MRTNRLWTALVIVMMAALVAAPAAMSCTIVSVGTAAMVDGSTVTTHNDDSGVADYRLRINPAADWGPDAMRDIVYDSHNYVGGMVVGQMPQAAHTYRYFSSRYSFINEMGVAMGEATFSYTRNTDQRTAVYNDLVRNSDGIIDCWFAQDIALERAATAREAVQVMGNLVETYGWAGPGETINIVDGTEVWIAEFYGKGLWAAVRVPDDHVFVAANRARIGVIDINDKANYMASPDIFSYAIEKGWYNPASGQPFVIYDIYAPYDELYSSRREWRGLSLVAPSLNLDPYALRFPFSVKPEKKLTVQDVWNIKADYYQGTEFDMSKDAYGSTHKGNPLRHAQSGGGSWERTINMHRTCYLMMAQIKNWLPKEIGALVWYGYGAPDTAYVTPLWPIMNDIPDFYKIGTRYEPFQREAGWWVSTYVQQMAEMDYIRATEIIHGFRNPRMEALYTIVPKIQETAAQMYLTNKTAALNLIDQYAYLTAAGWFEDWLNLGDYLFSQFYFNGSYYNADKAW